MADKSPDAYRTISEAGEETGLPAHVLRFWESRFTQLKPVKRAGGRRLYRPQDIQLLKGLKKLLYEEGYTIKGAQKYLKDHGVADVCAIGQGAAPGGPGPVAPGRAAPEAAARETDPSEADPFAAPHGGAGSERGEDEGLDPAAVDAILNKLEQAKTRLDAALNAYRTAS
jgi:DNA-binding transcriptional MerR regulator